MDFCRHHLAIAGLCFLISIFSLSGFAEPKLELKATGAELKKIGDGDPDNRVNVDFPEPTDIKDIARAVALWTGRPTIMDRNVNGKTQIIAPEKVTVEKAHQKYLVALESLGLKEIETDGVFQIVPARYADGEHAARRQALKAPDFDGSDTLMTFDYPAPTEIKDIIAAVAGWSGRRVVLDRQVNGKVQIISPRQVTKKKAYRIYLAALDQLGLAEVDRGGVSQIMPVRNAKRPRELDLSAPATGGAADVSLNYDSPTDIREILTKARPWYGRDLVFNRDVSGKVEILAPKPMSGAEAHKTLVAALDLLGLTMEPKEGAVQVLPINQKRAR
jgi:type II secretory pathway component GspD/PulD (secretin)